MSWWKVIVAVVVLAVFGAAAALGASKLSHRVFATTTVGHTALAGIACPTTLGCWAVGAKGSVTNGDVLDVNDSALVELINDTHRSTPSEPGLAGDDVALDAIACAGSEQCWAVGGDLHGAVIAHWSQGGNWRLVSDLPDRTIGRGDALESVACPSKVLCYAYGNRRDTLGYLLRWEASDPVWEPAYTPLVAANVTSIGCAGADRCFFGTSRFGVYELLAGSWSTVPSLPSHLGAVDVGCSGPTDCLAVVATGTVYRFDGTTWAKTAPPGHPRDARLTSCDPAGCWLAATVKGRADLLHQYGQHWRAVPSPAGLSAKVSAVGCMITRCLAVGARRGRSPAPAYAWSAAVAALPLRY